MSEPRGPGGDEILTALMVRVKELDAHFAPLNFPLSTRRDLAVEVEKMRTLVNGEVHWPHLHTQYLTIAALCYRALRDQQIPTLTAAELKTKQV